MQISFLGCAAKEGPELPSTEYANKLSWLRCERRVNSSHTLSSFCEKGKIWKHIRQNCHCITFSLTSDVLSSWKIFLMRTNSSFLAYAKERCGLGEHYSKTTFSVS
ncbi:hypothetical protein FRX31_027321 [Thalictrum thalictroides]|uniref:Uncharacterized protein n=1 Tax=Thalictrum thalictroides TaxID=46969 RepID=A0A7J6VDV7_THATH|nr:hypothetical protein FRX31_027321 [Thalictrum thalictroides]